MRPPETHIRLSGRSFLSLIIWISLMAIPGQTVAQEERTNTRGMGMARTSVIASRGLDAVGINPANLAYQEGKTVTIGFIPFGVHVGSNFLDYDLYTTYFTGIETDSGRVGKYLTPQDKQRILDAFPGGIGSLFTNVDLRLFGLAIEVPKIGTFAFTVSEHVDGFVSLPRDYVEFLLNGNPPGTTRNFSDTDVRAAWTREYTFSFGRSLQRLSFTKTLEAGISLKLIHGYGYSALERFNSRLETASNGTLTGTVGFAARSAGVDFMAGDNAGGYSFFPAPAGVGFAIDLGVSALVKDFISVGISLTDVGSMKWSRNAREVSVDTTVVLDDPFSAAEKLNFINVGEPFSGNGTTIRESKQDLDGFYSTLPTQLRIGVALQIDKWPGTQDFPGSLLVELDYNQGFKDLPGSTTSPRFSLGVEYLPLEWLPLRTGISVGGTDRFNVAFGFGVNLGSFVFDLATENVNWIVAPRSFSYASVGMGMKFRF
jgi:hypothetical protein